MKISNETKVGILVTVAIVIIIFGVNFLKGKNVFSRNVTLYAEYPNIKGLGLSNPVILYGVKVGQVDEFTLIKEPLNKVRVKLHIDGDVKIPENTIAKITSLDFLGSWGITLYPGTSPNFAERNDTLPGEVEESITESLNKVVEPVKEKVENLITSVDTIVTTLNAVFNEETKRNLRTSFKSVKNALENIESTTDDLSGFVNSETNRLRLILDNVNSIAQNIEANNEAITKAINNITSITDTLRASNLQKTINQTSEVMSKVNEMMNAIADGKGTAGKLLNDEELYNNLRKASEDLDKLILDLKQNPHRYLSISVFGNKKKKE